MKITTIFGLILLLVVSKSVSKEHIPLENKTSKISIHTIFRGGLSEFMKFMGKAEGHGSYQTIGGYHNKYLGLYQFHLGTLKDLGFKVTKEEFLSNPSLQDSAMITYLKDNANDLHPIIKKFSGTYYNGIYITKSGILAAAHLVGSPGVFAYFYPEKYKFRTSDANGTSVDMYIKKFANFKLDGI